LSPDRGNGAASDAVTAPGGAARQIYPLASAAIFWNNDGLRSPMGRKPTR
jgi:hypothetical protein